MGKEKTESAASDDGLAAKVRGLEARVKALEEAYPAASPHAGEIYAAKKAAAAKAGRAFLPVLVILLGISTLVVWAQHDLVNWSQGNSSINGDAWIRTDADGTATMYVDQMTNATLTVTGTFTAANLSTTTDAVTGSWTIGTDLAVTNGDITLKNEEVIENDTDSEVSVTFNDNAAQLGKFQLQSSIAGDAVGDDDDLTVEFIANDNLTNESVYANINVNLDDITTGTENATVTIGVTTGNVVITALTVANALVTVPTALTATAGDITATAGTLITGVGVDGVGAVDMDYGSVDITDHTFISDGGTVVLDGGIDANELTVVSTNAVTTNSVSVMGVVTLNGAVTAGSTLGVTGATTLAGDVNATGSTQTAGKTVRRVAKYDYSFASDGGAVGAISLGSLPDNAVVFDSYIDLISGMFPTNDAGATVAITWQSAADLRAATLMTNDWQSAALLATIPVGTVATAIKATGESNVVVQIGAMPVTAGVFSVFLEYDISD